MFIRIARCHHYHYSVYQADEGVDIGHYSKLMKLLSDNEVVMNSIRLYASSVNVKVEHPHQTIKNMVRIHLVYHGHNDELWCQY